MAPRRGRAKLIHSEPVGTVAAAAGGAVQHRQPDERFIIMYQEALERLAGEADLTLTQLRVLLKLMGVMDDQNYLVINQAGIAHDLEPVMNLVTVRNLGALAKIFGMTCFTGAPPSQPGTYLPSGTKGV